MRAANAPDQTMTRLPAANNPAINNSMTAQATTDDGSRVASRFFFRQLTQ